MEKRQRGDPDRSGQDQRRMETHQHYHQVRRRVLCRLCRRCVRRIPRMLRVRETADKGRLVEDRKAHKRHVQRHTQGRARTASARPSTMCARHDRCAERATTKISEPDLLHVVIGLAIAIQPGSGSAPASRSWKKPWLARGGTSRSRKRGLIESPRILVTSVVSKRRHMLRKNYQNRLQLLVPIHTCVILSSWFRAPLSIIFQTC